MKALPSPGTYLARRNGNMVIEQSASGALLLWIPVVLCSSDHAWTGKHMICIGAKDGTLQRKAVENLKKVFPSWDGMNPFELEEIPLQEAAEGEAPAAEFELADCYHDDSYTPPDATEPVIQFKAQWLNPIGGTQNMPEPTSAEDRKAILAKWGSKFKASSNTSARPAAAPVASAKPAIKTPTPVAAKAAVGGPPGRGKPATTAASRSSSQEEVWDALTKANPDSDETELGNRYYAAQDEVKPDANGDLTPQEWGLVATALDV